MDEGGNGGGRGPRPGGGGDMIFEFAQVRAEAVGHRCLDQSAEALDRIEFRAVRRQG